MTLDELRREFPTFTVRQEPYSDCHACKGSGVITVKRTGRRSPCFCAVSSMPHGEAKTNMMKEIGAAAKRIREREGF